MEENKEYVIPVRMGGLANQFFQVMAGEIYAMTNNKVCIITKETQNPHNLLHQEYAETVFRRTNFFNNIPLQKYTPFPQVVGFEHWEPINIKGNVVLNGYFQYYPPIKEHEDFVRQYFYDGLREFLLQPTQKVGLHVRKGDYVNNPYHDFVSERYYRKALSLFSGYNICVFSDDLAFCRRQIFLTEIPNIEFVDEPNELKALGKMISCQGGFICANSSFSWWGAWLGAHQAGTEIITVPSKWCEGKYTKNLNLIPQEWTIVEE
jgi:Glycosyl transferase family 11